MHRCRICGRSFDPLGFQVVVPGLSESFDRLECAQQARAALPAAAAAPPVTIVGPTPAPAAAAAAPAAAAAVRRPLFAGASLCALAAGAAVTGYLWLRVLGVDSLTPALPSAGAAPAFERQTMPALIETDSDGRTGERPAPRSGERPSRGASDGPTLVAVIPPSTPGEEGGDAVSPDGPRPGGGDGGQDPQPPPNPPPPPPNPSPPAEEPDDDEDEDEEDEDDDENEDEGGGGNHDDEDDD